MSFWKKLFGGGVSAGSSAPTVDAQEEHEGFTIKAVLMRVGSEYQVAGTIEKDTDGELKTYSFIRADKFGDKEAAASMTLAKGRQIIREQGQTLFS